MNRMEASLPSDWLIIARKDWNRINHMLEYDDFEACGLFLQQSLEKYLKAFLLLAERYPPLGNLDLNYQDIEKGLSDSKLFIKAMFPYEKLKG